MFPSFLAYHGYIATSSEKGKQYAGSIHLSPASLGTSGVEDGYVRLELDDGSVLLVAASWEGVHVVVERCGHQTDSRVGIYWDY